MLGVTMRLESGVAVSLVQGVLGIQPIEGYRYVKIVPGVAGGVRWCRGTLPTKRGTIGVTWTFKDDDFQLLLSLPKGARARVVLPDAVRRIWAQKPATQPWPVTIEIERSSKISVTAGKVDQNQFGLGGTGGTTPRTFSFEESLQWLESNAKTTIRAAGRKMPSGMTAFPPQVGCGYEAFWLRDYSYMLETCAAAFTKEELDAACRLFVKAIDANGAGVDCVKFTGEPIYKPGYGRMGSKPVADGSQFTVNVAYLTWKQTQDHQLLSDIVDDLVRAMKAVPLNLQTKLVHISTAPGEDRCAYGFTDSIGKRGDVFFCSLLYFQAAGRLAEMLDALGRTADAKHWRDVAEITKNSINQVFWDADSGLFLAATLRCRQPDIWGSSFAVWLKVASPDQAQRISRYFNVHYQEICKKGQIRHLPGGTYWDQGCARDTYQNGAYWATPTGWFVHTLALTDRKLAKQSVVDLVMDFRERGICEWIIGNTAHLPGYVASVTLPLQGVRELRKPDAMSIPMNQP